RADPEKRGRPRRLDHAGAYHSESSARASALAGMFRIPAGPTVSHLESAGCRAGLAARTAQLRRPPSLYRIWKQCDRIAGSSTGGKKEKGGSSFSKRFRPSSRRGAGMKTPAGFRYASTYAGIRKVAKDDLALIVSDTPAVAAAVFTKNRVVA